VATRTNRTCYSPNSMRELEIPAGWSVAPEFTEKKFVKTVKDPETGRERKVRYGAKGYSIAPGTDKGDRYCTRSEGQREQYGYDCGGKDRNTPLCLSRAKWKCSGNSSKNT
jgi:hypothetical protein